MPNGRKLNGRKSYAAELQKAEKMINLKKFKRQKG